MHSLRDRRARPILLTFGFVVVLAWIYVVRGAGMDTGMSEMDMASGAMTAVRPAWTVGCAALVFGMWIVMMTAMMLPSAAPAAVLAARAGSQPNTVVPAAVVFAGGYLAVWAGFSAVAVLAQWALDASRLLTRALAIEGAAVSGLTLIAIGLYQVSPWKLASLRRCNAAAGDGAAEPGLWRAARNGMRYGASCLVCCAALMGLLFVVGVMNVLCAALLAVWVFAEKTFAWGGRLAATGGVLLIAWGAVVITRALR
jgi:predicted metal-binding membrane protein